MPPYRLVALVQKWSYDLVLAAGRRTGALQSGPRGRARRARRSPGQARTAALCTGGWSGSSAWCATRSTRACSSNPCCSIARDCCGDFLEHAGRFALPSRFSGARRRYRRRSRQDARKRGDARAVRVRDAAGFPAGEGARGALSPALRLGGSPPGLSRRARGHRRGADAARRAPARRRDRGDRARLSPHPGRLRVAARALSPAHPRGARLREAAHRPHARGGGRYARHHARGRRGPGGRRDALLYRNLGNGAGGARSRLPHLVLGHRHVQERPGAERGGAARARSSAC